MIDLALIGMEKGRQYETIIPQEMRMEARMQHP